MCCSEVHILSCSELHKLMYMRRCDSVMHSACCRELQWVAVSCSELQ